MGPAGTAAPVAEHVAACHTAYMNACHAGDVSFCTNAGATVQEVRTPIDDFRAVAARGPPPRANVARP